MVPLFLQIPKMYQNGLETYLEQQEEYLTNSSNYFSGKLLLRREIPLNESIFQQLILLTYFISTPSIIRKKFDYQCQRCGNENKSLFAVMPCLSCQDDCVYCRKCIEMGRVIMCEDLYYWSRLEPQWPRIKNPSTWEGELTNEQSYGAKQIFNRIRERRESELLVWAVTGSGKTEMLFPGITEALKQGMRICIATPRTDVVRELLPRLQQAFADVLIQGLYGGSKEKDRTAQFIIATTHQLLRYKAAFDVLIIDEIDAFPYHADPTLPFATKRALKPDGVMIYLTATPRKEHQIRIKRNKLPHIFIPTRFHGHPLPVPKLKMCFTLKRDLLKKMPPAPLIKWLKTRGNPERQLLLFVPTIQLAKEISNTLAALLKKEGIIKSPESLQYVHAEDQDREEKILLFRQHKITVLVTTTILERGVTFSGVDVVVLDAGHIVFDEAALVQIAGRAGRSPADPTGEVLFLHEGKTDAMVEAVYSIISMNKRGGLA